MPEPGGSPFLRAGSHLQSGLLPRSTTPPPHPLRHTWRAGPSGAAFAVRTSPAWAVGADVSVAAAAGGCTGVSVAGACQVGATWAGLWSMANFTHSCLLTGVSEVRSARFSLIQKKRAYLPRGRVVLKQFRNAGFMFDVHFRGSAAYLVLSAFNGVLAREIESSERGAAWA